MLPESPPDSGSEHITSPLHSSPSPLHTSSSPSTLSTPSSLSPSTFSTPSPFSSQEVSGGVVSHYPFSSNTQQHQPSSLQHTQVQWSAFISLQCSRLSFSVLYLISLINKPSNIIFKLRISLFL